MEEFSQFSQIQARMLRKKRENAQLERPIFIGKIGASCGA
jgi:hypothetical protein